MGSLDIAADFGGQFWKEFADDIVGREAIGVLGLEIFFANHADLIDVKETGIRHFRGHHSGFAVEDFKGANDFGIGSVSKGKSMLCREAKSLRMAGLS